MKQSIVSVNIVTELTVIEDAFIQWENGEICKIEHMISWDKNEDHTIIINGYGEMTVVAGMIDIHIHGAYGADFMDATEIAIDKILKGVAKEGVTSILATTMTAPIEKIELALQSLGVYQLKKGLPEIIGVHLEGPFINPKKKGAQAEGNIRKVSVQQFEKWNELSNNQIKIVTIAPEMDEDFQFIRYITSKNIIASIGHSDATYKVTKEAIKYGAKHFTHIFNGMSGLHHRELGVMGAALIEPNTYVEFIADNYHFDLTLLQLLVKAKGVEQLIAITDSMRAKGMKDGLYELGGQPVKVGNGKCMLVEQDSLAGSILTMNEARQNILSYTDLTLAQTMRVLSLNAAKALGIDDKKGSLAIGKDADIVVINGNDVHLTVCRGEIAFQKSTKLIQRKEEK